MTEKQLETSILEYLNTLPGVFAFKVQTTGIFDPTRKVFRTIKNKHLHRGTSDILGLKDGKFFAIEVKLPKKKCTDEQLGFMNRIVVNKGCARTIFSFEEAVLWIKAI